MIKRGITNRKSDRETAMNEEPHKTLEQQAQAYLKVLGVPNEVYPFTSDRDIQTSEFMASFARSHEKAVLLRVAAKLEQESNELEEEFKYGNYAIASNLRGVTAEFRAEAEKL